MEIKFRQGHNKISKIIHSIHKSPESWEEWSCIYLDAPIFNSSDFDIIDAELEALMLGKLKYLKGTVFITEEKNVVILCQKYCLKDAHEAIGNIMFVYKKYSLTPLDYKLFSLPDDIKNLIDFHIDLKIRGIESSISSVDNMAKVKSILVVDDDPLTCKMLFNSLHDKHYIIVANNGEDAMREFNKCDPDLVLLDINMPKMDGREVLVKLMEFKPETKIVMFSSNYDVENMSDCINDGAIGFIPKPFNRVKIENFINNLSYSN